MMRKNFVKRTSALALAALMAHQQQAVHRSRAARPPAAPDTTAQAADPVRKPRQMGIRGKQNVQGNRLPSAWYTIWASRPRGTRWMPCWLHLTRPILKSMWMWKWLHPHPILQPIKTILLPGRLPDIMFGKPQTMQEFVDGGYFMDLKDEACMTNVLPMLVDECTVNGGVYGFPIDAQVKATFTIRKCLMRQGWRCPRP